MKIEELAALGLSDDQCQKVFELRGKELTSLQTKVGEQNTTISSLNGQLGEANKKLEGYDPEWKTKSENAKLTAEKALNEFKFNSILDNSLKEAKVKDVIAVKAHLNMDGLKYNDGKIVGLDEQLNTMKESCAYLFDRDEKLPYMSAKTDGAASNQNASKTEQANAALRAAFGKER